MSALDNLLAADAEFVGPWREAFGKFDPGLPDAFDAAEEMFHLFSRCIEGKINDSGYWEFRERFAGALQAQTALFLLLHRYYKWDATDLFRARASAAAGYRRLRAEAVGLLILMRQDPQVGEQWIAIRTDADGQAFFNRTKQRLKHILRSINLESAYDQGSGVSQRSELLPP